MSGLEQALVPVMVTAAAEEVVDHTVRNILIAGGTALVVGGIAFGVYKLFIEKESKTAKLEDALCDVVLQDISEVLAARAAEEAKGMKVLKAESRKSHPCAIIDDPAAALGALAALRMGQQN
jgi:hypothetical protein